MGKAPPTPGGEIPGSPPAVPLWNLRLETKYVPPVFRLVLPLTSAGPPCSGGTDPLAQTGQTADRVALEFPTHEISFPHRKRKMAAAIFLLPDRIGIVFVVPSFGMDLFHAFFLRFDGF